VKVNSSLIVVCFVIHLIISNLNNIFYIKLLYHFLLKVFKRY